MTKQYAVFGNPVSHSLSPKIHAAFAAQFGIEQENQRLEPGKEPGEFEKAVESFFKTGGTYCNITLPFKIQAFNFAKTHGKCSERAQIAGAVNTLFLKEGLWLGDNTDGAGLLTDLKNNGFSLKGKKILIVGAGGAVRGILLSLLNEGPERLVIVNRTEKNAVELAQVFTDTGKVTGCDYEHLPQEKFDLIINATSAGTKKNSDESNAFLEKLAKLNSLIAGETACYDLAYGEGAQLFLSWAKENGVKKSLDGLGMLVEQAAEAFFVVYGHRPNTAAVITILRQLF